MSRLKPDKSDVSWLGGVNDSAARGKDSAMKQQLTETRRRALATWFTHIGWWGALALTILDVGVIQAAPASRIARSMGIIIVMFIGIAIAASSARSRMRLSDTITRVFEAGLDTLEPPRRTCVMEAALDGVIRWVENADVIGWSHDALVGHRVADLFPDRFLRVYETNVAHLVGSENGREVGPALTLSLLTQDSSEGTVQTIMSRLDRVLIVTVVEVEGQVRRPAALMKSEETWREQRA